MVNTTSEMFGNLNLILGIILLHKIYHIGGVYINEKEGRVLSSHLKIPHSEFLEKFTNNVSNQDQLNEAGKESVSLKQRPGVHPTFLPRLPLISTHSMGFWGKTFLWHVLVLGTRVLVLVDESINKRVRHIKTYKRTFSLTK